MGGGYTQQALNLMKLVCTYNWKIWWATLYDIHMLLSVFKWFPLYYCDKKYSQNRKHGILRWKLIKLEIPLHIYLRQHEFHGNLYKTDPKRKKNHCRFIAFGIIKHKTYIILPIISSRFFPFKIYWFYDEWHFKNFLSSVSYFLIYSKQSGTHKTKKK